MAQTDLFTLPHKPWNSGRLVGAKAPLKPKHIWGIRQHLKSTGRIRDLAMFNCALDAKLRGCDLVKLRLGDVVQGGALRERSVVVQQKTGRPVPFEITPPARDALARWLMPLKSALHGPSESGTVRCRHINAVLVVMRIRRG